MDLADEIAYAAHDLEDAISFGFVSIAEMMHEFKISNQYSDASQQFNNLAWQSKEVANQATKFNSSEEYSVLVRKELTSNIVNTLMQDIGKIKQKNDKFELNYTNCKNLAKGLKKLVFKALQRKKDVQLYEKQGEKIIKGLFEVYTDTKFNPNLSLLPPEFRTLANQEKGSFKEESMRKRVVIDYIAGMMDSFAIQEYKRYFGSSSLDHVYDRNIWNNT